MLFCIPTDSFLRCGGTKGSTVFQKDFLKMGGLFSVAVVAAFKETVPKY